MAFRSLRPSTIFCLLLLLFPAIAHAEGPTSGGTRVYLDGEPVGAFTVSSFAAPNPPVITDRLWVTVQLRDGAKAVPEARVWVSVTPEGGEPGAEVEATHTLAATDYDYTAAIPVPEPGSYTVRLRVEHPQATGEARYLVRVSEPLTSYILLFMALPFTLLALALAWYFAVRRPREQANVRALLND